MSEDADFGTVGEPVVPEPEDEKPAEPPVRVAIDLTDAGGESMRMHVVYLPDGKFDPTSPSHQAAYAIQMHLRHLEDLGREDARAKEQAMIAKAVLKVCEPVQTDEELEALKGPSDATN